ncbi:hypothetical protein SDD30_08045 [Moorella naiadis]|uniref:hypothetical protein n=1 Tax=Moorella naiadis (nom. illeg.) TaxID=3093670 RepID=UPI003D9CA669
MRRFLILLTILFWLIPLVRPARSTAISDSLRQQLQNNANEESRLLQEIMLLDTRLQKTRDESLHLAQDLITAREELQAARSRQAKAEARLAAGRQDLDRSLRFFQAYGASPYILAAFFSHDLPDFFIRWELLKYLGNHFLGIVRNNLTLYHLARQESMQVAAREKELQRAQAALQAAGERLAALKQEREAELDNLRRQSSTWSRDLLALEGSWSGALPTLQYLLGQLPTLPWKNLKPDAVDVDFARGEVLATFSQQNLNATLLTPEKLPGVRLDLTNGNLLIPGPDFQIQGSLQVAGAHQLFFIPQGVTFAGLPLSPTTWSELLPQDKLIIDLPPPDFDLKFKDIKLAPGRMILILQK